MAARALIVGCGGMGKGWIKNVRDNDRAEVAGLVDIRIDMAKDAVEQCEIPGTPVFDALREAIQAVQPDFVVDVTVPEAHCDVTVAALGEGLPVVGEKPMADSMDAARRMVEAAEQAGKTYMVSQSRRYNAHHVAYSRAVQSGVVGDLTTVNCDFYLAAHFGGFRAAMASPLILDMSIHHFDMCRFITGKDAVSVYAHEFNPKGSWYRGDVAASVIFEMTDGVVFTYCGSWCSEGCNTSWNGHWRAVGQWGTLMMEKDQGPYGEKVKNPNEDAFKLGMEPIPVEGAEINGDGIKGSLNEFLDCLESGATPQSECHDNIKSLAMVFAAIESSRKGERVGVVV